MISPKFFNTLNYVLSFLFFIYRSKDYTAPVNFVSAGLRKTAAEEKQQKEEEGSEDSDDSGPSAPPASRGIAPKKLQMVNNFFVFFNMLHCIILLCTIVAKCIFFLG